MPKSCQNRNSLIMSNGIKNNCPFPDTWLFGNGQYEPIFHNGRITLKGCKEYRQAVERSETPANGNINKLNPERVTESINR